jgi:hypothetical protein
LIPFVIDHGGQREFSIPHPFSVSAPQVNLDNIVQVVGGMGQQEIIFSVVA